MAEYYNVTTNLGDAEIADAITNNAKIQITHIAFGDGAGSVPTPSKTRTTLVREVHRQAVTKYEHHSTNPNWIVIETIIPSDVGGFTIREMGIIGNGKLLSHGSHAPFEKVADPSGVSEYRLKFTQNITDGNVVSITLDDSLIYATQAWVEENFIKRNEIVDDLTTDDATKPVSARQAKLLDESLIYATQAWIDENYIKRSEIVDNLTTDDATKVTSARTVKELQDNKLDKNANAVSAAKLQTARNINGVSFNGTANINIPGVGTRSPVNMTATRLLNTVYTNTDIIPRVVSIFGGRSASARNTIIVDGEIFSEIQAANNYYDSSTMLAIVPPGKEYKVTGSPISRWVEQ